MFCHFVKKKCSKCRCIWKNTWQPVSWSAKIPGDSWKQNMQWCILPVKWNFRNQQQCLYISCTKCSILSVNLCSTVEGGGGDLLERVDVAGTSLHHRDRSFLRDRWLGRDRGFPLYHLHRECHRSGAYSKVYRTRCKQLGAQNQVHTSRCSQVLQVGREGSCLWKMACLVTRGSGLRGHGH